MSELPTPLPEGAKDIQSFTPGELDKFGGALLYIGGLNHTLSHVLDVTRDLESVLELFEYINYGPASLSIELLSTVAMATAEVRARFEHIERAIGAALDSTVDRIVDDRAQLSSEFEAILTAEFGEQAKKDGLS